ncbi:glycosyl hydrolase family 1 [Micromonospora kangleipakensis]|uniref:Glycosyl hydrolase family 1 n=1 Tax=Micromonospora kangleipakensis TaxID=1077942 RepID=A0A4Q8BG00_9ACTN|nr:glycosyl hydrolase family 1 [Micromonospora kangleipakensis]
MVQNGYLWGHHAPGRQAPEAAYLVTHHLQLAHGLAVQALRATGQAGRIGPALNLHPCYPADDSPEAAAATRLYDGHENRLYLDSVLKGGYPQDVLADLGAGSRMVSGIRDGDLDVIASPVDLLAVQHYTPIYVTATGDTTHRWPTSEADWQQIHPEGMYDILTRLRLLPDAAPGAQARRPLVPHDDPRQRPLSVATTTQPGRTPRPGRPGQRGRACCSSARSAGVSISPACFANRAIS